MNLISSASKLIWSEGTLQSAYYLPSLFCTTRNHRMESASIGLIDNKTQSEKRRRGMRASNACTPRRLFFSSAQRKHNIVSSARCVCVYRRRSARYWDLKYLFSTMRLPSHAPAVDIRHWVRDYTCIIRCTIFHFTHACTFPLLKNCCPSA